MKKVLFITSRNIFTTCGEIRLIKNRAEALYQYYGVATDFLAIAKKERINAPDKEEINSGGVREGLETQLTNPISVINSFNKLKKITKKRITSNEYSAVILSGTGPQKMASVIKSYSDIKIIVDCHGASETTEEALRKYSPLGQVWHRIISATDRRLLKTGFKYFDGCFVVSPALERYEIKKYNVGNGVKFFKIPCATTTESMELDKYIENRVKYRNKYGIKDNEVVFVYSGGVSSWQCIEEAISLYKRIKELYERPTRLMVFSHMIDSIKKIVGDDREIIIDSYSPVELEKALCAGDYAFLLRRKSIINEVAFPNKYLEYVKSGMRIITTPYVDEIANQVKEYGIGYIYDFDQPDKMIIEYLTHEDLNERKVINIADKILEYNGFKNRLKPFVEYIES